MKIKYIASCIFLCTLNSLCLGQSGSDSIQATSPTGTVFAKDASVALKIFPGSNNPGPSSHCCDEQGNQQSWTARPLYSYAWSGKASGTAQTSVLNTSIAGVFDVTCVRTIIWDCVSGEETSSTKTSSESYTIVEVKDVFIDVGSPCPSSTVNLSSVTIPASRGVTYSIVSGGSGASISGATLTMPNSPGASVTIKASDSVIAEAFIEKTFTNASLVSGTINISNTQYGPTQIGTMRLDFDVSRDQSKCSPYPSGLINPTTNGQANFSSNSGFSGSSPLTSILITGSSASKTDSISNAFMTMPSNTESGAVATASATANWYVSSPSEGHGDGGASSQVSTSYTF